MCNSFISANRSFLKKSYIWTPRRENFGQLLFTGRRMITAADIHGECPGAVHARKKHNFFHLIFTRAG